ECQAVISTYSPAHDTNKKQLAALQKQLQNTESLIKSAEAQLVTVGQQIFDREVDLEYQRTIFNSKVRSFYIRRQYFSPFLLFLASDNAAELTRELSYRVNAANEDKKMIMEISQALKALAEDKAKLEQNQLWLAQSKQTLSQQTDFLAGEVAKVEDFLNVISTRVASLTAKQEALLSEKVSTFQTSVGEVPLADDPNARPDFNPGFSPAWAAFSFGAPHQKGMSQYGALGRAKAGQGYEQILKAYYGDVRIEHRDLPADISTTVGVLNFEDSYLKGIAEMPSKWADEGGFEALKAQAIAARSYAVKAGKPICVTEACQVYSGSKNDERWNRAVAETRGLVVVSNQSNDVISTWYASTAGGYLNSYTSSGHTTPGVWDTSCGNQGCWTNEAWEKKAGSPWFYKGWYKSRSGATCGRSHPWLNNEEMADILNAVLIYRSGQGSEHILPVDYVSCFGSSGEPWSLQQMRDQAGSLGGSINTVTRVEVTYGSDGKTNRLVFETNRGGFEVGGEEFYTVFNLRAPGRLALKSKLFNLEKK
ncbi:hypothetical protein COU97_02480, partial [Candidatus Shapirobacteria bacterium CG10_big_fil_rev_8_21_14_0_10_48_15]